MEDYIKEITVVLEQRKWQEAKTMIQSARRQYPEEKHFTGVLGMACAGLGEIKEMQQCFDDVFDYLEDTEEKLAVLGSYITVMCLEGYYDDALHMAVSNEKKFAGQHFAWQELLINTFIACDQENELIKLAEPGWPAKEASGDSTIRDLTDAINIILCWNNEPAG
jgi:hypothetical protein